ncbi:MAG TPA: NUDIX domain-containing protein [Bacteroidia bacterium]|jgi:8-oxo-dGTP diphosphatase|nr:NUDIX domain-containing protein [Bacteroidia bacterium]
MAYPFNVRVYGLWVNNEQQVLVADELIHGLEITKFPGGGLEFGESTIDCIVREMMEETRTRVEVIGHFYTTDFFQVSAFNPKSQVISIYYRIRPLSALNVLVNSKPFDFDERKEGALSFRFISLKVISQEDFTFPIDKRVASLLLNKTTEK